MEVTKFRSQFLIALEQAAVHLHHAQTTLAGLVKSDFRARQSELRELFASSFDAILVGNDKITKQLSVAIEQMTAHLRREQDALTGLVRTVADKPRRRQEAVLARENQLQRLLASSFDAIVVTNADRSVIAANPVAVHLFGVSQANLGRFTLDAFLPRDQIPSLDAKGSRSTGGEERHGQCKIRRLDGGIRVADYVFVANFIPFRHLCRFRKDREWPPIEGPLRMRLAAERKHRHWPL